MANFSWKICDDDNVFVVIYCFPWQLTLLWLHSKPIKENAKGSH